MIYLVSALLILMLIFGPQVWTRHVFKRYSVTIDELPGTGGELAMHLLNELDMPDFKVEETEEGNDHYDPRDRSVRLSPEIYHGKSLTAVTVAAHEVGHALQHKTGYRPMYLRSQMAGYVATAEKLASIILVATPVITLLTRVPHVGLITLLAGITILLMPVAFHLVTLPVEWNASFNRALPILQYGRYLPESAMPVARRILTAAALTYVAASLASLLNFYRWMIFLRR